MKLEVREGSEVGGGGGENKVGRAGGIKVESPGELSW